MQTNVDAPLGRDVAASAFYHRSGTIRGAAGYGERE